MSAVEMPRVEVRPNGGLLVDGISVLHQGLSATWDLELGAWVIRVQIPVIDLDGHLPGDAPVRLLYVARAEEGRLVGAEAEGGSVSAALRALADVIDAEGVR